VRSLEVSKTHADEKIEQLLKGNHTREVSNADTAKFNSVEQDQGRKQWSFNNTQRVDMRHQESEEVDDLPSARSSKPPKIPVKKRRTLEVSEEEPVETIWPSKKTTEKPTAAPHQ